MTARVTATDVRKIIDNDEETDMEPFIAAATSIVDYVVTQDTGSILNTATLKEIERWLAAHFYAAFDQLYTSKSTGGASGSFQGQFGQRIDSTDYGQRAIMLDFTGTLASLSKSKTKVSMQWIGLPPSEQTDYVDRD